LDIGCGTGDLYNYLKQQQLNVKYTGCDIVKANVAIARKKYMGVSFLHSDFIQESFDVKGNLVFGSGLFGLNAPLWEKDALEMVKKLVQLSEELVVLNFLSESTTGKKSDYHYTNEKTLLRILDSIEGDKSFLSDYTSKKNDLTLIIRLPKSASS
jgi:ubiquinone/menaquinone biosynthesis C-methylase UbiE